MILEEAPEPEAREHPGAADRPIELEVLPWVISGRGKQALSAQAERLCDHVEADAGLKPADIGFSLASTRAALTHRAVVLGGDRRALSDGLRSLGEGRPSASVVDGFVGDRAAAPAFLFTGQGSQRLGMGRELYDAFPQFRDALEQTCAQFDGQLECSLLDVMLGQGASRDRAPRQASAVSEAELLDETRFTQPALFALEVALFRLLETLGLRPAFVMGHSVGELAAAHVAGVVSLEHACALVGARGRLMAALPRGGAMMAAQIGELDALYALEGLEDRVALAAVNAPDSIVVSGEERAVLELARAWEERGVKTKRLRVSHAFHSPLMEPMLEEFQRLAAELRFSDPAIPVVSNVTGRSMKAGDFSPEYWARQVRDTVRFADGVHWLRSEGVGLYLELGPDGVLSSMTQECLAPTGESQAESLSPRSGAELEEHEHAEAEHSSQPSPVAIPLLRAKRPEVDALMHGLAESWVRGASVQWSAMLEDRAEQVELPTYAFQRKRYWLQAERAERGDPASVGQTQSDHPFLGAAVALPEEGGALFTGRLSLASHDWLSDHGVMGAKLLPASAFVELALHVGDQLGCDALEELALVSPLILARSGSVQIQLMVSEPDPSGRRGFSVHARSEPATGEDSFEAPLTCHATGTLCIQADTGASAQAYGDRRWPPQGALAVDVESLYEELLQHEFEYGPSFRGLQRAWRLGECVFAEVALGEAEAEEASRFGIHPALLDGALHAVALALPHGESEAPALPVSLSAVRLHAGGASRLRVQVSVHDGKEISLVGFDEAGAAVVEIGALATRPATREQLVGFGARDSLFELEWASLAIDRNAALAEGSWSLIERDGGRLAAESHTAPWALPVYEDVSSLVEATLHGASIPQIALASCPTPSTEDPHVTPERLLAEAHASAAWALELIQAWLAHEPLAAARLVLITRGALATSEGDELGGLAQSTVWGLVRAAQSEIPGRIVIVDLPDDSLRWDLLAGALDSDEPQIALRGDRALVPRLGRSSGLRSRTIATQGTVLITGGTGGIGALLARRLVEQHGARAILLVSRAGPQAPGAAQLVSELSELGAHVSVAACDVADRAQVRALLEGIPSERALGAVVHAAGVLDDGLLEDLTADRLASVLRPKVDGAMHLHELTAELDLSAFVLFSSASATLGAAGQGSYAAANAFLDALVAHRRARGLVGVSMAWGLWDAEAGMAARIEATDRARVLRAGMRAMSPDQALDLFEASLASNSALVLPMALDMAPLRAQARLGNLPAVFRGLLSGTLQRAYQRRGDSLLRRMASAGESERERVALDVTLAHTAAVLGHPSAQAIEPLQSFKELGFDSLTAVELRNRLSAELGSPLPATLVFDNPTPQAVSRYLVAQIPAQGLSVARSLDTELTALDGALSTIASDGAGRDRLAAHLRTFLAGLEDGQARAEGQVEDELLRSATAEEVFELIDRELGPLELDEGTHAIG